MIGVDLYELQYDKKEYHGEQNAQPEMNVKSLLNDEAEKRHASLYSVSARLPAKTAELLFV